MQAICITRADSSSYGRIPSFLAAQGYESALLLDAAIERVKGNVADKEAFKAALKQGVANSVRGVLKFNNKNFPKDAKGRVSLEDHRDTVDRLSGFVSRQVPDEVRQITGAERRARVLRSAPSLTTARRHHLPISPHSSRLKTPVSSKKGMMIKEKARINSLTVMVRSCGHC